jgi:hypothetical protein
MKILVTGNPRSGTLSMKNMLRSVGYDVQHEHNGRDGTSSCFFFMPATYYPREKLTMNRHRREKFNLDDYDVLIHLVRNPLHCIPSMAKVVGTGHQEWLEDHGVVNMFRPKMSWSAAAWCATNMRIEAEFTGRKFKRIQIENVLKQWPKGLLMPKQVLHQHAGTGTRRSVPLTVEQLREVTPIYEEILVMGRRYGYDI